MNPNEKNDSAIDAILTHCHREIEPPDSWQALRTRINRQMESEKSSFIRLGERVIFWRRMALAMAACLFLTATLLIYIIVLAAGDTDLSNRRTATTMQGLFSQAQLNQLMKTFSNVRELFGEQLPWMVVGSTNDAEIGVDQTPRTADSSRIVVVRLAVNLDKPNATRRYFDIVTFPNQQVTFQMPMVDAPAVNILLKPILKNNSAVAVEINAKVNGDSDVKSITTVDDSEFASLVRLRANGEWVNIDGIGQSMPNI
jgi:hypothetical protein